MPKFQILDKDGNSILGNLTADNVYLKAYAVYQEKHHTELEIGEKTIAKFSLSGESGYYTVKRVE